MLEPSCNLKTKYCICAATSIPHKERRVSQVYTFTALRLQVRIVQCLRCCAKAFVQDFGFR